MNSEPKYDCLFCHRQVPLRNKSTHDAVCRNQFQAMGRSPQQSNRFDPVSPSKETNQGISETEEKLPCEYCSDLIPLKFFTSHEELCLKNPRNIPVSPEHIKIPCELCEKNIPGNEFENHLKECSRNQQENQRRENTRNQQSNAHMHLPRNSGMSQSQSHLPNYQNNPDAFQNYYPQSASNMNQPQFQSFSQPQFQPFPQPQYQSQNIQMGMGSNPIQISFSSQSSHPGLRIVQFPGSNGGQSRDPTNPFEILHQLLTQSFLMRPNGGGQQQEEFFEVLRRLMNSEEGLDKETLDSFTVIKFDKEKSKNLESDLKKCLICLEEFEHDENVKFLLCLHRFHEHCINPWLEKHTTCPVCKKDYSKVSEEELH